MATFMAPMSFLGKSVFQNVSEPPSAPTCCSLPLLLYSTVGAPTFKKEGDRRCGPSACCLRMMHLPCVLGLKKHLAVLSGRL